MLFHYARISRGYLTDLPLSTADDVVNILVFCLISSVWQLVIGLNLYSGFWLYRWLTFWHFCHSSCWTFIWNAVNVNDWMKAVSLHQPATSTTYEDNEDDDDDNHSNDNYSDDNCD